MKKIRDLLVLSFVCIFFMLGCQESDSGAVIGADGTSSISSSGLSDSSTSNAYNKLLLSDNLFSEGNRNVVVLDSMVILRWELPGNLFEVTTLDHESRKEIKKETVKGNTHFINSLPYGKKYEFHVKDLYSEEVILLFAETGNEFVQTSVSDVSYVDDGMILTWNAVPYAAKYNLYYSDESDGTYNFLKEVYGTSVKFDDKSFYQDESEDKILFFSVEAIPINNTIEDFICKDEACEEAVLMSSNYIQPQNPSTKSGYNIIASRRRDSRRAVTYFKAVTLESSILFTWTPVRNAVRYDLYNSASAYGTYTLFKSDLIGTSYTTTERPVNKPFFKLYPIFRDSNTGERFNGIASEPARTSPTPPIVWNCTPGAAGTGEVVINVINFSDYDSGTVKLFCDVGNNNKYALQQTLTQSSSTISYPMESSKCYVTGFKYFNVKSKELICSSSSFTPESVFTLSISSTGKEGGEFDNIIVFEWDINDMSIDTSGYRYSLKVVDNNDNRRVLVDSSKQTEMVYRTSVLFCNVTYRATLDVYPNATATTASDTIEKTFRYDCGGKVTILNEKSFGRYWLR